MSSYLSGLWGLLGPGQLMSEHLDTLSLLFEGDVMLDPACEAIQWFQLAAHWTTNAGSSAMTNLVSVLGRSEAYKNPVSLQRSLKCISRRRLSFLSLLLVHSINPGNLFFVWILGPMAPQNQSSIYKTYSISIVHTRWLERQ